MKNLKMFPLCGSKAKTRGEGGHDSVKFYEVSESPYERGYKSGLLFQETLKKWSSFHSEKLHDSQLMNRVQLVMKKSQAMFPDYFEEIQGKADGAGIPRELCQAMMCPELLGEETGCSTVLLRRSDGTFVLSHNEDDDYNDNNFAITKVNLGSGKWFVTNDCDKMPFGNGFSWNSHGIVKVINYCHVIEYNLTGIPRYFSQRHISEATSLDDLVQRCNHPNRASGYHVLAIDVNKNKAISVEITHDDISINEIKEAYVHTNHYIHEKITNGKIFLDTGSNSLNRLRKLEYLLSELRMKNRCSIEDLQWILSYRGREFMDSVISYINDPYLTVANMSIDTATRDDIILRFYLSNEKFKVGYDSFRQETIPYFIWEQEANTKKEVKNK